MVNVTSVYTDSRFPNVELWQVGNFLRIRNGKQGKPLELNVPVDNTAEEIADAFFKGMAYQAQE